MLKRKISLRNFPVSVFIARMTRFLSLSLTLALAFSFVLCGGAKADVMKNFPTIFAAPDGKYDAPGTEDAPLSLAAAQVRARTFDNDKGEHKRAIIKLLPGTYYLSKPLVFTREDKGICLFSAYRSGADSSEFLADTPVILSGGRPLSLEWKPFRDGILGATIPADVKPFDQLFINDELQVLARYPNFDPKAQFLNGTSSDASSPARVARWKNPVGGFIHALHRSHWGDMHYRIVSKSADNKLVLEGGWQNNRPEQGPHKEHRFVEGIFEELDAPGEWFFDAETHTLYFYPPAGLDLAKATVVVPQLENLVHFAGTRENPVQYIHLNGIIFKHTLRTFMKKKEPLQRSDWCVYRGGAVLFENAEECSITNSAFTSLGGNAIFVNNYNKAIGIIACFIHDIGANAIAFVGDPAAARSPLFHYSKAQPFEKMDKQPGPKGDNFPQNCIVQDTLIVRLGRVEKQTTGVNIDLASRITVQNCTIAEVPRAGINIGSGTWGGHILVDNDIFDTVRETGDHGSFNSWGRDRFWYPDRNATTNRLVAKEPTLPFWDVVEPIRITHNRWRCDRGWDIDLDDGSTNYIIRENLCLNGGIKLREGYGRIVENNIIVNNGFHPHAWFENSGDVVRKNIFYKPYLPSGSMRVAVWGKELDYNLLHSAGVVGPKPAVALQKSSKQDAHSITADALFIDSAKGNYRVAEGSPALALGFKNFDMENFGVASPWLQALAPKVKLPGSENESASASRRDATVVEWHGARVKNVVGLTDVSAAGLSEETGVLVFADADKSALFRSYGLQNDDVILKWGDVPVADIAALRAVAKEMPAPATLGIWRTQRPVTLKK